ncbi:MAG: peptidase domain-containing ABC transporter [Bacteroidota bacterium]
MFRKRFKIFKQLDAMDCGPTCLKMICRHYGKDITRKSINSRSELGKVGTSLLGISEAAESFGFHTRAAFLNYDQLFDAVLLPVIIYWERSHFVVVSPNSSIKRVEIANPATGIERYTKDEFLERWTEDGETGIALLLEPGPSFYNYNEELKEDDTSLKSIFSYLRHYRPEIIKISCGLLLGSLIQLVLPYLTQSIIDEGVNYENLTFIKTILLAQFVFLIAQLNIEFIRSRILLYVSTRINVALLTSFWIKVLKIPISFFEKKTTGDLLQRITDHNRIEQFLTSQTLTTAFSTINLIVFSIVIASYSGLILLVFILFTFLQFAWITVFLNKRKVLDKQKFLYSAKESAKAIEIIEGIKEIKLNNAEASKRWEWEEIQVSLFRLSFKTLSLEQLQQSGGFFINRVLYAYIIYLSARQVIDGDLTLGSLIAIQYIIGGLVSPVDQLISFIHLGQDAKLSLERLNEVHNTEEEGHQKIRVVSGLRNNDIKLENISFSYPGSKEKALRNLNTIIPKGKVTAIIGPSGSGKTTLIKLLQKFYEPQNGIIRVGSSNLNNLSPNHWRSIIGSSMQDGYIFNDSIANNIALGDLKTNLEALMHAMQLANIADFVENLPQGFNTKIGADGVGISSGQKQRILLARALYRDPSYLFLDEATNALDSKNEGIILNNLREFNEGRTVVVSAHRLSTIKDAFKIILLKEGLMVEEGNHEELLDLKGNYYQLIGNQLH